MTGTARNNVSTFQVSGIDASLSNHEIRPCENLVASEWLRLIQEERIANSKGLIDRFRSRDSRPADACDDDDEDIRPPICSWASLPLAPNASKRGLTAILAQSDSPQRFSFSFRNLTEREMTRLKASGLASFMEGPATGTTLERLYRTVTRRQWVRASDPVPLEDDFAHADAQYFDHRKH